MSNIDISHLAKLSRLTLTEAEERLFSTQASEAVEYVKNLNDLDTTTVTPTSSVTGTINRFRDDVAMSDRKLPAKIYSVTRIM